MTVEEYKKYRKDKMAEGRKRSDKCYVTTIPTVEKVEPKKEEKPVEKTVEKQTEQPTEQKQEPANVVEYNVTDEEDEVKRGLGHLLESVGSVLTIIGVGVLAVLLAQAAQIIINAVK